MAKKSSVKVLIDWLSYTVRLSELQEAGVTYDVWFSWCCERLHLGGSEVQWQCRKAQNGYSTAYVCNGITFAYGGRDDVFVNMSGSGCRMWETLNQGYSWQEYLSSLFADFKTVHFSRLDIAGDSFDLLDMGKVMRCTVDRKFVSKWRKFLHSGGNWRCEVIFGSPKSEFFLRIYDKTLERKEHRCKDVPENWVRCEFQMRNDRAGGFLHEWLRSGDLGHTYAGVMRNQLVYWRQFDGHNYDRIVLQKWWSDFIGDADSIRLPHQGGLEYNLENLERYVYGQAASSIKTLLELSEGDLTQFVGRVNTARYNDAQRELLARAKQIELPGERG